MKTILLILLNLQLIYGTTFNNTSNVYDRNYSVPASECRLGYTTRYGNGFNSTSTFGYPRNTHVNSTSTFGYTTGGSSGSGRPGQPRRAKGYTADGDEINTPDINPDDMWNPKYTYYYGDDTTPWWVGGPYKRWFRMDSNGNIWWWNNGWHSGGSKKDFNERTVQYYKDSPVPIGDPSFFVILGLLFLWMTYDIIIHPMIKKDKK